MFGLGFQELVIILVIALIIFGPGKLPQIGSGLGRAMRDFRKGISGDDSDETPKEEDPTKKNDSGKIPG